MLKFGEKENIEEGFCAQIGLPNRAYIPYESIDYFKTRYNMYDDSHMVTVYTKSGRKIETIDRIGKFLEAWNHWKYMCK